MGRGGTPSAGMDGGVIEKTDEEVRLEHLINFREYDSVYGQYHFPGLHETLLLQEAIDNGIFRRIGALAVVTDSVTAEEINGLEYLVDKDPSKIGAALISGEGTLVFAGSILENCFLSDSHVNGIVKGSIVKSVQIRGGASVIDSSLERCEVDFNCMLNGVQAIDSKFHRTELTHTKVKDGDMRSVVGSSGGNPLVGAFTDCSIGCSPNNGQVFVTPR